MCGIEERKAINSLNAMYTWIFRSIFTFWRSDKLGHCSLFGRFCCATRDIVRIGSDMFKRTPSSLPCHAYTWGAYVVHMCLVRACYPEID